jgi:hypothetical protein
MRARNRTVALAAAVCLGCFGSARLAKADDLSLTSTSGKPIYMDDAPPPKPAEALLGKYGMGQDKTGINVYGYVEGGYTASFANPPGNVLAGRVFELNSNEQILLDQIDLVVEKTVDAAAAAKDGKIQVGGRMEWTYGSDPRYYHSNGMNFYGSSAPQLSPENQFDLTQAYVDVAVPFGNGLTIRTGKFVTLLGYETINPTTNPFYSHTYSFGYAIPFTQTGVLGSYSFSEKVSLTAGITRGWDQSLVDNNAAIDFLGSLKYVINDKVTSFFNLSVGPQLPNEPGLYTTLFENILNIAATDKVSLGTDSILAFQPGGGSAGQAAQWYGVALYSGYKFNDMFTANLRGEWFADPQDARGLGGNEYEVTAGVSIHPMPTDKYGQNLVVRPEIRYDYSSNSIFDAGTQFDQWTVGIDAFYAF